MIPGVDMQKPVGDVFSTPNPLLRKRNQETFKKIVEKNEDHRVLREAVKRISKRVFDKECDINKPEEFPVLEPNFNWKGLRQRFEEADSASSFVQVLRAGVQTAVNAAYQDPIDLTYEDWVSVMPSSKDTELYAPLHGITFPREIGRQEKYPEARAVGMNISLRNRKFGLKYAVEKELLEDDQTGQFVNNSKLLGEYMRYVLEVWCYGKLASVANMQYADLEIPITETKESDEPSSWPWVPASTGMVGGGFNRPATFTLLTQPALQVAKTTLLNQKNKLGLKLPVNGRRILCGPNQSFDASVILNSTFYPSGAAAAGATGGAFAINPVKGIADLSVAIWIGKNDGTFNGDSYAWYLVDDRKPWFVAQLRSPISVEQENPQSGASFETDVYQFKSSMRGNADFIDSRFAYQGNDGSITPS